MVLVVRIRCRKEKGAGDRGTAPLPAQPLTAAPAAVTARVSAQAGLNNVRK